MGLGYFQDTNSFPHNYAKELFIVLPDLRSHTRRDIIKHFELAVSIMRPVGKAYDYLPRHLLSTKLPNKIILFSNMYRQVSLPITSLGHLDLFDVLPSSRDAALVLENIFISQIRYVRTMSTPNFIIAIVNGWMYHVSAHPQVPPMARRVPALVHLTPGQIQS